MYNTKVGNFATSARREGSPQLVHVSRGAIQCRWRASDDQYTPRDASPTSVISWQRTF
jgi:hypothetical protein